MVDTKICGDGHATPDLSPPYRKAPKGYNSIDDDDQNMLKVIVFYSQ